MKNTTLVTLSIASILMFSATLRPQMPPQQGKLTISSEPTGEPVTINGRHMNQLTNATFIVSPGNYRVSVASANGGPACGDITLGVAGGQTVTRNCTRAGWK
jgi:PEGA domain